MDKNRKPGGQEHVKDQRPVPDADDDFFEPADDAPPRPAPQPPAPPPKKSKHSALLLKQARDAGISDEEIEEADPADLRIAVALMGRESAAERRQESVARGSGRDTSPLPPPRPAEPAPEAPIDWGEGDDGSGVTRKFTDADIHPAVLKVVKDQRKLIEELSAKLGIVIQAETARRQRTIDDVIDDAFDSLPEAFQRLLGKGSIHELDPDSAELKRRKAVFVAAGIDMSKPLRAKAVARALQEAAETLYPDAAKAAPAPAAPGGYGEGTGAPAPEPRRTPPKDPETGRFLPPDRRPTREEWDAAGSLAPSHRTGAEELGPAAAEEEVRAWKYRNGVAPAGNRSVVDDFPD